ncbi:hypothetical protein [Novosphingobium mathurense]|uniref:Uncharacterized protein n=1 Tax=Novosphingobium mathurense TaxID=428990 RepID=A0A1U6HMI0_9SPHN|nr:hypothetical protein [Novosphingobium mathurense]SLJ97016.1 hypothetical protein SAMN06295987_102769 [Novosphingobium mathurense]
MDDARGLQPLVTRAPGQPDGHFSVHSSAGLREETGVLHDLNGLTGAQTLPAQGAKYGC